MKILQFLLGVLVILSIIGTKPTLDEDGHKVWVPSRIIVSSIFVVLFVTSFYSEILLVGAMISGVGLFLTYLSFISMKAIFDCSKQVDATVVDMKQFSGEPNRCLEFKYYYERIFYYNTCLLEKGYNKNNRYEIGKSYPIYLNPKNPDKIQERRVLRATNILLFLIAISFFGSGLFVIFCFCQGL